MCGTVSKIEYVSVCNSIQKKKRKKKENGFGFEIVKIQDSRGFKIARAQDTGDSR